MSQSSSELHSTLMTLLKSAPWKDVRHLSTLCWMVTGLLTSGWIALSEWTFSVIGRAVYAQSIERRFRRFLANQRIDALQLYAALFKNAVAEFPDQRLYLALDTTLLWNMFCVVQLSLVWRGRSIPAAWKVLPHKSASVAFKDYRGLLRFAARMLKGREVVLLADRGFIHTELLQWVKKTPGWHFCIRCKRDVGLFQSNGKRLTLQLSAGQLRFYAGVLLGKAKIPVEIAVGWEKGAKEPWIIVTDESASQQTLKNYGLRFCIEESFLDCKSAGFQWESSKLRETNALQRLCLVMAVATLVLVVQGADVVATGKRRQVDTHWFRGLSYARIGWNWIRRVIACGGKLIEHLTLPTAIDPEPARASRKQPDRSRWTDDLPCQHLFLFAAPSST